MTAFTDTTPEELTPLNAEQAEATYSAAVGLLRQVATDAAQSLVPDFGRGFFPVIIRVYAYLLAIHDRLERNPDMSLEDLRAELNAHRAPFSSTNPAFDAGMDVLRSSTNNAIINWHGKSYALQQNALHPEADRDRIITALREAITELYPILALLDEELLGLEGSDGGTTP